MKRSLVPGGLVVALLLAASGCGGGDSNAGEATSAPTTQAPTEFDGRGPYGVGVRTLELPSGPSVEVWYPSQVEGGTDTYDVRDFLPAALQEIVPAGLTATYSVEATRRAKVADGQFPLVLYSHGFSGFRMISSELMSKLASWGFVVAAPDHPSRNLEGILGGQGLGDPESASKELLATIDLMEAADATAGGPFEGHVDTGRIVAVGHSAGGGTILQAGTDPRIDGYVSLASANQGRSADGTPAPTTPLPAKPSLFIAGAGDEVIPATRTRQAFSAAPAPTHLWVIDATGHNAFDDVCEIGQGQGGLIGLADKAGLGAAVPQSLRSLATDGCEPPNLPVTDVWPAISHAMTSFVRWVTGVDAEPIGLGAADAPDLAPAKVAIDSRAG